MLRPCVLVLVLALVTGAFGPVSRGEIFSVHGHNFTLPEGFEVELAAGPDLAPRPVSASFDDQGRLYVTDSSGSNARPEDQLKNPDHRILRLDDSNGDGTFDTSVVFADRVMFPQGCLWHEGSVYVAAPPSIWKFTDTDRDGVADRREEWFKGGTLTGCANDIHGPYLGPDGFLYWTKGAFAEQTHRLGNGRTLKDRAAHIYRAKPDGSELEVIMSGGMDNPVEVAFTAEGEPVFTSTFIDFSQPGWRDGIAHAVYGGVYGKENDVLEDGRVKRTSPGLLHPFVQLGAAAPSGLCRYESGGFGSDYRDNLFATAFNLHKVTRHVLRFQGATYASADSDFLASDNADFHPTDVLEDADGSLLVVDTGGWYKLCCPSSQLVKADVLGAIYRVRAKGPNAAPRIQRDYARLTAPPSVRWDKLSQQLDSFPESVWKAQNDPRNWLNADFAEEMRRVSDNPAAMHAMRRLAEMAGRSPNPLAVPVLLAQLSHTDDAFLSHSLLFALIQIADSEQTRLGLKHGNARTHRAALIALDQMDSGALTPSEIVPFLNAGDEGLREAANWILGRRPEWGEELAGWFREQLTVPADTANRAEFLEKARNVHPHLRILVRSTTGRQLLADAILQPGFAVETHVAALEAIAQAGLKDDLPEVWMEAVHGILSRSSDAQDPGGALLPAAVRAGRSLNSDARIRSALMTLACNETQARELRLDALASLPSGASLSGEAFEFARACLRPANPPATRSRAADVLARSKPSPEQLLTLTQEIPAAGPLELNRVLAVFDAGGSDELGRQLIGAIQASPGARSLPPGQLRPRFAKFSDAVRAEAEAFLVTLDADLASQGARLDSLLSDLKQHPGDIRRGQAVFNSSKAACSACHKIGYLGGNIGPDLTSISQARGERDLLEAILYPSASFVRSYEPVVAVTREGEEFGGVLRKDASDELILATGPNTEVRLPRSDVAELRPGGVSVMPQGLEEQLTLQELADLMAFLKNTRWGPQ